MGLLSKVYKKAFKKLLKPSSFLLVQATGLESVVFCLLAKSWISCVYTDFMLVSCKEQSKAWLLLRAPPTVSIAPQRCPRVRK